MPPLFRKKPALSVDLDSIKKPELIKKPKSTFKTPLVSKFKLENFVKNHTESNVSIENQVQKGSSTTKTDYNNKESVFDDAVIEIGDDKNQSTSNLNNCDDSGIYQTKKSSPTVETNCTNKKSVFDDTGIEIGDDNNQSTGDVNNCDDSGINTTQIVSPDLFGSRESSQILYSNTLIKGAYLHFLEKTKPAPDSPEELSSSSQVSNYSMNDPFIKEKFLEFLKKRKTNKKSKKSKQPSAVAEKENSPLNKDDKNSNHTEPKKKNKKSVKQAFNSDSVINKNKPKKKKTMRKADDNLELTVSKDVPKHIEDISGKQKIISTEPKFRSHKEKMEWLLETHNVGLYVLCDRCNKTRYLKDVSDPLELPDKWYCENHPDGVQNSCHFPQLKIPDYIEQQLIENLYNAGSIVWAHLEGYPWWPAMVDDCPETEEYFWLDDLEDTKPTWYHVTYLDTAPVTRNWLKVKDILPFNKYVNPNRLYGIVVPKNISRRLEKSIQMAKEAQKMSLIDRLRQYSFIYRYKKPISFPNRDESELKLKPRRNARKTRKEKVDKLEKSVESELKSKPKRNVRKAKKEKVDKVEKHKKFGRIKRLPSDESTVSKISNLLEFDIDPDVMLGEFL